MEEIVEDNNSFDLDFNIPPENLVEIKNYQNEFTCIICLGIALKPLLLKCCERLICSSCLKKFIKLSDNNPRCPVCKSPLKYSAPPKIIMRMYDNLFFSCPNGCPGKLRYDNYFDHILNLCEHKPSDISCKKIIKYCNKCKDIYQCTSEPHQCDNFKSFKDLRVHAHNLSYTNIRKHFNYEQLGWICDFCGDDHLPNEKSYHCKKCLIDICCNCLKWIQSKTKKALHMHELALEKSIDWICNICGKENAFMFSWTCEACDYDVCIKCLWG